MHSFQRWTLALAVAAVIAAPSQANSEQPVSIEQRARGAHRVVVARIAETSPRYERNEFGDNLIVTYARLEVEEALKGEPDGVTIAVEGGTIGGMTMRASSLPSVARGERAVFFLTRGKKGEFRPHLRGQGILKLGRDDRVPDSSLTLAQIRRAARAAQQERP